MCQKQKKYFLKLNVPSLNSFLTKYRTWTYTYFHNLRFQMTLKDHNFKRNILTLKKSSSATKLHD